MDSLDSQVGVQPHAGDVVAGKYRLDRILGAGGMGMVFAATHLELDRVVAVKFVHATYCQHAEVIARFLREAKALVRIESEHVAKVIDVGRSEDGTPYMVMEYLDGEDLSELLQHGPVSVPDAVDYIVQACAAMLEAHEMGIVHRDLKPANLFLTHRRDKTPLVKVLDFGISKLNDTDASQAALTNPSMLMGSPAYMSPEQLANPREVDPRTDLWSLGVILFELLTGRPAFQAGSLPLLMTAIMQQEPARLEELRPDVPPGLVQVVNRCLQKSVETRFQSVPDLVSALLPFAPRRSHWSIERIAKSAASGTLRTPQAESFAPTLAVTGHSPVTRRDVTSGIWTGESSPPDAAKRPSWMWPAVVALAIGVVGAVAWLVLASKPSVDPAEVALEASAGASSSLSPGSGVSPNAAASPSGVAAGVGVADGTGLPLSPSPSSPASAPEASAVAAAAAKPASTAAPGQAPRRPRSEPSPPRPQPVPQPAPAPQAAPAHAPTPNPLQMDIK